MNNRAACQICGRRVAALLQVRDLKRVCYQCSTLREAVHMCGRCGILAWHIEYWHGLVSPDLQYRCSEVHVAPCGAPCVSSPAVVPRGAHGGASPCSSCGKAAEYPASVCRPTGLRTVSPTDPVGTRVLVLMSDPFSMHLDEVAEHREVPDRCSDEPFQWVRTSALGWFPVHSGAVRVLEV